MLALNQFRMKLDECEKIGARKNNRQAKPFGGGERQSGSGARAGRDGKQMEPAGEGIGKLNKGVRNPGTMLCR